jgi:hypothetical protein
MPRKRDHRLSNLANQRWTSIDLNQLDTAKPLDRAGLRTRRCRLFNGG